MIECYTPYQKAYILIYYVKDIFMKNIKQQNPNRNTRLDNNRPRPENKDNLDSREGEEQLSKGDDITHNKKERKNPKKGLRK